MKDKQPTYGIAFVKFLKLDKGYQFLFETDEGKFYSPLFETEEEAQKWFSKRIRKPNQTKEDK